MVTVRRALEIGGLRESRLVAGEKGLDRVIEFVDIIEVPDVIGWIRPHEFLITCAYAIRDDPAAQVRLIRALSQSNASGLAVKASRFLGTMPQTMIEAANEENLPLVDVPGNLPFIEITHPLLAEILSDQVRDLQFQVDVHRRLVRLVLDKNGLDSVCAALAEMLDSSVHILDSSLRFIAGCPGKVPEWVDGSVDWKDRIEKTMKAPHDGFRRPESGLFVTSIRSGEDTLGYLAIDLTSRGTLSAIELKAVEEAVTVCGLEMSKLNALKETEWRLKGDFLAGLLRNEGGALDVREAKARALEIELDRPYVVMVAWALVRGKREGCRLNRLLADAVRGSMSDRGDQLTAFEYEDSVVAIRCIRDSPDTERKLMDDAHSRLAKSLATMAVDKSGEIQVSMGVSTVRSGLAALATAHMEAVNALTVGLSVHGPGRVSYYSDLAPYMLLREVDGESLEHFWKDQLGPLAEKRNRYLLTTLRVFLQSGGEVKRAAKSLHIHRNTLGYRLRRIGDLLDRNLRDPDVQFRLRLALLAKSLTDREDPPVR